MFREIVFLNYEKFCESIWRKRLLIVILESVKRLYKIKNFCGRVNNMVCWKIVYKFIK